MNKQLATQTHPPLPLAVLRSVAHTALAGFGLLLLAACGGGGDAGPIPTEALVSKPSNILSAGDEIRVSFPGAPELNSTAKLQANGRVSLPLIGDVSASGRSPGSLQSELAARYKPHLQDPQVFVSMEKPAASVYVSGEVLSPGKLALDRPLTALEAVMESGGFSKLANPKKVYVLRNENGKHQRYVLNLKDTLSGFDSQAFYLRPFDVVYVNQSNW